MNFVLAVVVGYIVGSINPADIIARVRHVDYRSVGSGNPGATNIARAMGKKTGILVAVLDILKGFLPAFIFWWITDDIAVAEVAGLAAVLGHITSPFLKGHGGKGVATALGAILAIEWVWLIPILAVFAITFAIARRMGIASVAGVLTLVLAALVYHPEGFDQIVFAFALALLVTWRHKSNILALLPGRKGSSAA